MQLPGGLWRDGERETRFRFREPTGNLQLRLSECALVEDRVERTTQMLVLALESLGEDAVNREQVMALCVDDRRWLMLQMAKVLGVGTVWLTSRCEACEGLFDIQLDPAAVPVKPAGRGYPFTSIRTSQGLLKLHVPTGADQHTVAELDDEEQALQALIASCCEGEGLKPSQPLTEAELERASARLEATSPEVALGLSTSCPACGADNELPIDPYSMPTADEGTVLDEVDALARAYGWTEGEILGLPLRRRREYLRRVDRDLG